MALQQVILQTENAPVRKKTLETLHRFYRGTLFQAIVLGLISFTQPGIWVALNNLGAGGQASPFFVNSANIITFAIMVIFCPFCAVIGNRLNLRWVLIFGTIGYVPYSAALYCNSVFGTEWFLEFGAVTCGFSAAALWTAEAALAVGYPEEKNRGLYIGIWLGLNKLGSIIGTSISLALNISKKEKGSISPNTYLVLVALQCLGLPLSLLIAPAHKLVRTDGTRPSFESPKTSIKRGFKNFWAACRTKKIHMLIPIFVTAQWGQTYNGNYLTEYFTVSGRALGAFLVAVIGIIVDFGLGWILDLTTIRRSLRARICWVVIVAFYTASWIYSFVVQEEFKNAGTTPNFDIDSRGYGRAVGIYCLYRVGYEAANTWVYWLLGTFDDDIDRLALTTGLLRSGESLGSTFSYAVGSTSSASLMTNLIIAAVVFFVSVPSTTWSAWQARDLEVLRGRAEDAGDTAGAAWKEDVEKSVNLHDAKQ